MLSYVQDVEEQLIMNYTTQKEKKAINMRWLIRKYFWRSRPIIVFSQALGRFDSWLWGKMWSRREFDP